MHLADQLPTVTKFPNWYVFGRVASGKQTPIVATDHDQVYPRTGGTALAIYGVSTTSS